MNSQVSHMTLYVNGLASESSLKPRESMEYDLPIQGADQDAEDAKPVGQPVDLFLIEPLAPQVAGKDDRD